MFEKSLHSLKLLTEEYKSENVTSSWSRKLKKTGSAIHCHATDVILSHSDDMYSALKKLIKTSRESRKKFLNKKSISQSYLFKEICTIRLASSRSSGHSTTIKNYCKYNPGMYLVMYPNERIRRLHEQDFSAYNSYIYTTTANCVADRYKSTKQNFDIIFVDNSSLLSKEQLENVYNIAGIINTDPNKLCICLLQ